MKNRFTPLWIPLLLITGVFAPSVRGDEPEEGPARRHKRLYVPGEVIVKYRDGQASATRSASMQKLGAVPLRALSRGGMMSQVRIPEQQSVEETIEQLHDDPAVEYAQPNYLYHALAVPNDPDYGQLWGLKNIRQRINPSAFGTNNPPAAGGSDMRLEPAWDLANDCSGVVVAVIDTGVHLKNQDLEDNLWTNPGETPGNNLDDDGNGKKDDVNGWDFVADDNDPTDQDGHGTHVAGTIGARGNNGLGTTGICWKTQIMALRVLDSSGTGSTADITAAINYATAEGAKVINMSLGGPGNDNAMNTAINNASNAGVVVVVAAGNTGTNNETAPTFPCNSTAANLVCVAALDQAYQLASFSNFGTTSVDVGAPGTNIRSSWSGPRTVLADQFRTPAGSALDGSWNPTTNVAGEGWGYQQITFENGIRHMLTSPPDWNNGGNQYVNNLDAKASKTFNLAGFAPLLEFSAVLATQARQDQLLVGCHPTGGDPFANSSLLDALDGSTDGESEFFAYDADSCRGAAAKIGFQMRTDASVTSGGVSIFRFQVSTLNLQTDARETLNGTSMATPHVAGLAALIRARNPAYSAADVVEAIKFGGREATALCGKTTTGRSADALGSLSYIKAPQGVTAVAQ